MEKIHRLPTAVWHLLLITLLGLPLVTPLLRWTAVPCTHDGHLHYHRIAAMRHAWENGLYFTRWLPDLAFGYGYPFFVYREPLPLYLGLFPHLLGLSLPAASNLIYIFAILASGWFTYLWVRDILGARAAFVSAVAYMAAPYVLIDALVRGNLPESLALPLFPLLLWSGRRWLLSGTVKTFSLSVLGLVFLSLSHNISLLLFTPTLLLYLLVIGWLHRLDWRVAGQRLLLLFGFGLGITIFYTGGALLELDEVTITQSTTTRNNDFRFNFTAIDEIFAPVSPEDPLLVNPPLPFRLGWVPTMLAALGLITFAWNRERQKRGHIVLMGMATAVFLFMSHDISRAIWETLPLIDFVQFPWRFVGRAALPVAFLAGAPFAALPAAGPGRQALRAALVVAVALLLLEALPMLYPTLCAEASFPPIGDVHTYEQNSGLVGVDPEGSYFPNTVKQRPDGSPLLADYQAERTPQRFDRAALPAGAVVDEIQYGRNAATVRLNTPVPFMARYLTFAFPGWFVTIDGHATPIIPSDPQGLITFPVPSGEHTLTIGWRSTPLRTLLLGLSIMALAAATAVAVVLAIKQSRPTPGASSPVPRASLAAPDFAALLLLAAAVLAFKGLIVDNSETPLRRSAAPAVTHPITLQAAELQLAGFNLSRDAVAAGETFDINLAWTAVAAPVANYQSNIWLAGPEGLIWSDKNTERPRLYEDAPRTRFWLPGQWGWDSREVQVYSGTPPGIYNIVLTLFDRETLRPLTLVDPERGNVRGPAAVIGRIEVLRPATPPTFDPQFPLQETAVLGLKLLGYNQDRAETAPGEQLLMTFFWEKGSNSAAGDTFVLQLLDDQEEVVHRWQLPFGRADYLPAEWQAGERVRGQHLLRLPAGLDSGVYQFALENMVLLSEIAIHAPQRLFEQPEVETAVHTTFYNDEAIPQATLVGYTLQSSASNLQSTLSLSLVWQAQREMTTSYHVFVHAVSADGQIIAQSDGQPVAWSRPTTGWVPGEYVIDLHQLVLPGTEEPLALHIGLYDADTNQRLRTETAEFVTLSLQE